MTLWTKNKTSMILMMIILDVLPSGDRGRDLSSDPTRISGDCESAPLSSKRGLAKLEGLWKLLRDTGHLIPIELDIDGGTYNIIRRNSKYFAHLIRSLILENIPTNFLSWYNVPDEIRTQISNEIE
ncbi:hypothetical protein PanWU01x14_253990, partial [Parasponia andersonii]